jgi:hypothetical protein
LDSVKYALDFVDSTGVFKYRLDSMYLCDSAPRLRGTLRSIVLNQATPTSGQLEFRRIGAGLKTAGALWQDIISQRRMSEDSTFKRARVNVSSVNLALAASPNPLRNQSTISFAIPEAGVVSVQVLDIFGRQVSRMKASRIVVALFCAVLLMQVGDACWNTANAQHPSRRADSAGFVLTGFSAFDRTAYSVLLHGWRREQFGPMWQDSDRYVNLWADSVLGFNCELRNASAYFDHPTPDSMIFGGAMIGKLKYLISSSIEFDLTEAPFVRFECERHDTSSDLVQQYYGFLKHTGLTGKDVKVTGASSPSYAVSSPYYHDSNAVEMMQGRDAAGVFDSAYWEPTFLAVDSTENRNGATNPWHQHPRINRKLLCTIRLKVSNNHPTTPEKLLRFTITQKQKGHTPITILDDTVYTGSRFPNAGTGVYDTLRFHCTSQVITDTTNFRLYWFGIDTVYADYLELTTGHVDSSELVDTTVRKLIDMGNTDFGPANGAKYGSGEDLTSGNDSILIGMVKRLTTRFQDSVTYIWGAEEVPIGDERMIKRVTKLLRDSSHGKLEYITILNDSNATYHNGLPNTVRYATEGVAQGWLDSANYADPKAFIIEPYAIDYHFSRPKRVVTANDSLLHVWERAFVPIDISPITQLPSVQPYSRNGYLNAAQGQYQWYVKSHRMAQRATTRANTLDASLHQRYFTALQSGAGPVYGSGHGTTGYKTVFWGSLFPPTGTEFKVLAHLAISAGSNGLMLYDLNNASNFGINGGIMNWNGDTSKMFDTFTVNDNDTARSRVMWVGWKERFDSAKAVLPVVHRYGDTLYHSKYITDRFATEGNSGDISPYVYNSIRTYNDSMQLDSLHMGTDTANKTFVHVSIWQSPAGDTMLYITNMRTDDSYDSVAGDAAVHTTTIDRRLIMLKLKRPHRIMDVMDTTGGLDPGAIWTPYVGVGSNDSLKVWLNAGDGILVRLMDTLPEPMQMMAAPRIDYPKSNQLNHFYDHGRIVFDQAVSGVRNPSTGVNKDWSIPSTSRPYSVGIPNPSVVAMHQDSLLYQKPATTRTENYRHHQWTVTDGSGPTVNFTFKDTLPTVTATQPRPVTLTVDSIAHAITITTDLEGRGNGGKIKFFDPWFVDSASFRNYNTASDTLSLNSPWLPGFGALSGANQDHYGGVFLSQNEFRTGKPMYGLSAFRTINAATTVSSDVDPLHGDWCFMGFTKNDLISTNDPEDWTDGFCTLKNTPVVFRTDGAVYNAEYKRHEVSIVGGPVGDEGFSWNNQRKVFYVRTDPAGNDWYRYVYSSVGRIFTCYGWKDSFKQLHFLPEQLLSSWSDTSALFPAEMMHQWVGSVTPTFHYVYQHDGGSIVFAYFLQDTSTRATILDGYLTPSMQSATPAISGADPMYPSGREPLDVVAWQAYDGTLHVVAADLVPTVPLLSTEYMIPPRLMDFTTLEYDTTEMRPSIWMDSAWVYTAGIATMHFWVSWQVRDTVPFNPTDTEYYVYALELQASYDGKHTPTITTVPGESSVPTNITKIGNPIFVSGRHPCISGCRIATDTEVVRVSFEADEPVIAGIEGISVVQWRTGRGWVGDYFFQTSNALSDRYTNPSIECSRYHGKTTTIVHDNYYTMVHERLGRTLVRLWAYDSATNRLLGSNSGDGVDNPQVSVVPNSHDSLLYMFDEEVAPYNRAIGHKQLGLFKIGTNDSLWEYRAVTEFDSSNHVAVKTQIGEFTVDDGSNVQNIDVSIPDDRLSIDSANPASYFMRSETFTLPPSGSLAWYFKGGSQQDSLYRLHLDTVTYVLEFVDTGGTAYRFDSVTLCDSVPHIAGSLRTVTLHQNAAHLGYLHLQRITPVLLDSAAQWEDIITDARLSSDTAYKRSNGVEAGTDVLMTAVPNPLRNQTEIGFVIPESGAVTIDVFDVLGRSVTQLASGRMFHAGSHSLYWSSQDLPSGMYLCVLRYGNSVKTLRLSVLK